MKRVSFRNKTKRSCTDRNIGESTSLKEGLRDKALVAGISLGPGGNRYIIIQGSRLYSWRRTPRNWGEFAPRPCRNAAPPPLPSISPSAIVIPSFTSPTAIHVARHSSSSSFALRCLRLLSARCRSRVPRVIYLCTPTL